MRLIFRLICENTILCLIWVMAIPMTQAQQTYSQTYHLEVGSDNRAQFFFLEYDNFVVATTHSGDTAVVSALTRIDFDGNIIDQSSYSDFVINGSRTVVKNQNGFELSGHRWSLDHNLSRGLQLVKFNDELDTIEHKLVHYEIERNTNLPGILDLGKKGKVVYGSFIDTSPGVDSGVYIGLLDKEDDSIQAEVILKGSPDNPYIDFDVFDLQETIDGNMLFIAETRPSGQNTTGSGSEFEIVKFNWEGEILNRIVAPRSVNTNQAIAQDDEGSVYFFNTLTPFFIDSTVTFPDRHGGLVKLNAVLDSVLWSFQIYEKDGIDPDRFHTILGINKTKDNHLLAFGRVVVNEKSSQERIGFLCKFSKEGEILWVREYGIPIPEEYLGESLEGVLTSGRIEDCKELEDGRLLCMGESAYSKPETSFYRELWILMLDENGCLEPDCASTSILTNASEVQSLLQGKIYPNPVSDILHIADVSFDEYKIYDLMGRLILHGDFVSEIHLRGQMSSGMYVLQLKEKGRLKSVFKFLKE